MSSRRYDAIIIGGGIIGLSLALELRTHLQSILVIDRGPIGREASFAAAGMLNAGDCKGPKQLQLLSQESARMYPSFIGRIQDTSGFHVDFQRSGALVIGAKEGRTLSATEVAKMEPHLVANGSAVGFVPEDFVEPRSLMVALEERVRRSGVTFEANNAVTEVRTLDRGVIKVQTRQSEREANVVINCAGAWARDVGPINIPSRPMKGQMIAVKPQQPLLTRVVRCDDPDIYMLPRESGVIAIGATVEDVGFETTVNEACNELLDSANRFLPDLKKAQVVERWAGLRPGTPDDLPIMGTTEIPGYFVATGHYRSGILLAPATAKVMTELIVKGQTAFDLSPFALSRFARN